MNSPLHDTFRIDKTDMEIMSKISVWTRWSINGGITRHEYIVRIGITLYDDQLINKTKPGMSDVFLNSAFVRSYWTEIASLIMAQLNITFCSIRRKSIRLQWDPRESLKFLMSLDNCTEFEIILIQSIS